jgi:hypothetical protein
VDNQVDNQGVSDDPEPQGPAQQRARSEQPARRGHRRVVRPGAEREQIPGVTDDERGGYGENDDRLLRDVPPHWGR